MNASVIAGLSWLAVLVAVAADICGVPATKHAEPVLALAAAFGWTYAAMGWKE